MNEAEMLFAGILNCSRLDLYLNKDLYLDKDKLAFISSALKRRISGESIEYILGKTEFMGLEFKVNKDVFIPRPETEILVETVMKYSYGVQCIAYSAEILDLGTGSGCIAVSLAKFLPNSKISALDISMEALKLAQYNASLNNVSDKISFMHSDLFAQYAMRNTQYDIIVSNPPYIPTSEIDTLQPEIKYEPRIALDGGKDGLDFYRKIISQAPVYLREGSFLIMEIGFNQAAGVKNIFQNSGNFEIIEVVRDYNNIDRVIVAKNINSKH